MTLLSEERVKARKPHQCDNCRRQIDPGEVYERQSVLYDGTVYTNESHIGCGALWRALVNADLIFALDDDLYPFLGEAYLCPHEVADLMAEQRGPTLALHTFERLGWWRLEA